MRSLILASVCVSGLLLATGGGAEDYTVVEGTLSDTASGESEALTGGFEARIFGSPPEEVTTSVAIIDDFELQAGDRTFLPREPIEYDGQVPFLYLEVANQINFDEQRVSLFRIRSGGDLVSGPARRAAAGLAAGSPAAISRAASISTALCTRSTRPSASPAAAANRSSSCLRRHGTLPTAERSSSRRTGRTSSTASSRSRSRRPNPSNSWSLRRFAPH
jgi:hypothetical protein